MRNNKLIIIAALLVGFGIAWIIKPSQHQTIAASTLSASQANDQSIKTTDQEYTCSMHPQVRQNEPGICPICEMDLTPLDNNPSSDPTVLQMTEEAIQLANIQTTLIGQDNTPEEEAMTPLSGKIQADERLTSSLVAHIPGRIEKLYVTFTGETVRKGQKLADIYAPDLIAAQGELIEALKLQELNPALLEAARNKLRYWKINETTIQMIEQQGLIQESFTLYAETGGIVTNKRVNTGDYLRKGEALFEVVNLRKVWALFDAYEEELQDINIGDKIAFSTPSLPGKVFNASVSFINPVIDAGTRAVSIRTEVDNRNGELKPEMLIYGSLRQKKGTDAPLKVPKSAVLWTGTRSVVYVKVPETEIPSFQFREVELGEGAGLYYQIVSGLENGEEIVTNGSFSIDAAAQLNNQASMMNQHVQVKKEVLGIPNFKAETSSGFQNQLADLASTYISLKDAFVATDANASLTTIVNFRNSLENVDMSLLKGDAHQFWQEQLEALNTHSEKISTTTDIEAQRKQFGFLSEALINTLTAFGISEGTLYVQHCPMAFDNTGADWLSEELAIQNPYFGDKMMKCGVVKTEIGK